MATYGILVGAKREIRKNGRDGNVKERDCLSVVNAVEKVVEGCSLAPSPSKSRGTKDDYEGVDRAASFVVRVGLELMMASETGGRDIEPRVVECAVMAWKFFRFDVEVGVRAVKVCVRWGGREGKEAFVRMGG